MAAAVAAAGAAATPAVQQRLLQLQVLEHIPEVAVLAVSCRGHLKSEFAYKELSYKVLYLMGNRLKSEKFL